MAAFRQYSFQSEKKRREEKRREEKMQLIVKDDIQK